MNRVSRIMTEGHDLLKELSVSNESLDLLVSTALIMALCKATGGGRGLDDSISLLL